MSVELHPYGVQRTIYFPLVKAGSQDFAVSGDYTHASGDVRISKDGGAFATATNAPSAISAGGNGSSAIWSLTLTAAEMQAAEIVVIVSDAATKAVEDQCVKLHTFGNASAKIVADLSVANLAANVIQAAGTAWASGAITSGTFASGAITATAIATDAIGSDELAAGAVSKIWTSALTEAYAADGATFTGAQALYMLWSLLAEKSVSSTTVTCKKLDGSTTSMTLTLDSASAPTSITRAT